MTYLPLCSDSVGMCADRLEGGFPHWLHCVNTPQNTMSFPIGHLVLSKRGCSSSLFTKGFLNASRKLNLILLQCVRLWSLKSSSQSQSESEFNDLWFVISNLMYVLDVLHIIFRYFKVLCLPGKKIPESPIGNSSFSEHDRDYVVSKGGAGWLKTSNILLYDGVLHDGETI